MLFRMDVAASSRRPIDHRRLRSTRDDRDLTREELAAAAGVAVRTIASIEAGESEPRRATVAVLAMALGVEADSLLKHDDPAMPGEVVQDRREVADVRAG